jgi:hypothetical protein
MGGPDLFASVNGPKKLVTPKDFFDPSITRTKLIERFLREWMQNHAPKTNVQGAAFAVLEPLLHKLLNDYSIDLLLHVKQFGLDKFLLGFNPGNTTKNDHSLRCVCHDCCTTKAKNRNRRSEEKFPLVIVAEKPKKPFKAKVELEEVSGGLASEVKKINLSDVKTSDPPPITND